MNTAKLLAAILSTLFILPACLDSNVPNKSAHQSSPSSSNTGNNTSTDPSTLLDTSYLKIQKDDQGSLKYSVKKSLSRPVFIGKDGTVIDNSEISDILYDDFQKIHYILIPDKHWFTQQFLHNPFLPLKNSVDLTRPNIWGFELTSLYHDADVWIVERAGQLKDRVSNKNMSESALEALFPSYKTHLLGQGGVGKVYEITHDKKAFALKSNATEIGDLEKLQFSNAVMATYASFTVNNQPYLIMEKGVQDLSSMNGKKQKLSEEQLRTSISRFKHLLRLQKELGIDNTDIKPENILITSANELKLIDISSAYTPGYRGTGGELLAKALLSNSIGDSLRGGHLNLERYTEYTDPSYRHNNIASPYLLGLWYGYVCEKVLHDKGRCTGIKSFPELLNKFAPSQLYEIGKRADAFYKDSSGTIDDVKYGPYKTGFNIPNLQENAAINWGEFFNVKDTIAKQFCRSVELERIRRPLGSIIFPTKTLQRYEPFCTPAPGSKPEEFNFVLTKAFLNANDPEFQTWIRDAYERSVLEETFKQLARENRISSVYPLVFSTTFDLSDPNGIGKALWELYTFKP